MIKVFPQNDFLESIYKPKSISEAEKMISALQSDLSKIGTQLADKKRQDKMNLQKEEYDAWRHKAIHARNVKHLQISALQQWIKSERAQRAVAELSPSNLLGAVARLVEMIDPHIDNPFININDSDKNFFYAAKQMVNE